MVAERIFTTFNFRVEIVVAGMKAGEKQATICKAAFAECNGLELSMQPKTFQQGGLNTKQVHLAGPATYGQLTLKRGMSKDFGLWQWFNEVLKTEGRKLRGQARVVMLDANKSKVVQFNLIDCLPTKLRVPTLNAKEGGLAIEEMQLVYAAMDMGLPD